MWQQLSLLLWAVWVLHSVGQPAAAAVPALPEALLELKELAVLVGQKEQQLQQRLQWISTVQRCVAQASEKQQQPLQQSALLELDTREQSLATKERQLEQVREELLRERTRLAGFADHLDVERALVRASELRGILRPSMRSPQISASLLESYAGARPFAPESRPHCPVLTTGVLRELEHCEEPPSPPQPILPVAGSEFVRTAPQGSLSNPVLGLIQCALRSNCGECNATPGCGWCAAERQCRHALFAGSCKDVPDPSAAPVRALLVRRASDASNLVPSVLGELRTQRVDLLVLEGLSKPELVELCQLLEEPGDLSLRCDEDTVSATGDGRLAVLSRLPVVDRQLLIRSFGSWQLRLQTVVVSLPDGQSLALAHGVGASSVALGQELLAIATRYDSMLTSVARTSVSELRAVTELVPLLPGASNPGADVDGLLVSARWRGWTVDRPFPSAALVELTPRLPCGGTS